MALKFAIKKNKEGRMYFKVEYPGTIWQLRRKMQCKLREVAREQRLKGAQA